MTCNDDDEGWSRVFKLSDFGIAPNEQFIIKSGQMGISNSTIVIISSVGDYPDLSLRLFEQSYWELVVLGKHQLLLVLQIIQTQFDNPIVVPAGVERILVTVSKFKNLYDPTVAEILVAGTTVDTGESLYYGCGTQRTTVLLLAVPVPNANFFINVTGEAINKKFGLITRLSHNICDDVIETDIHSCSGGGFYWARDFTLNDFGISNKENNNYFRTSRNQ
jgi:hypothetical protein